MSNSINESLRLGESLSLDGKMLKVNHASAKMIGEVTIEEYDKSGNKIFSSTETNDVTLAGSIFVLEQIFKKASSSYRFLHKSTMPTGKFGNESSTPMVAVNDGISDWNGANNIESTELDSYIEDEHIFGFMIGHGGETASSVVAPKYESSVLADSNLVSSFLPLRVIDATNELYDPIDDGINYYIKLKDVTNNKNYFYSKGFSSEPNIFTKWADGSGNVQEGQLDYDIPILTYAEVILNIDEKDVREYFDATNSEQCYINQLGLVAGKPVWTEDSQGTYKKLNDMYVPADSNDTESTRYRKDYDDVKLVTTLNFKSKDLSNDENKLKFIYKVYCL